MGKGWIRRLLGDNLRWAPKGFVVDVGGSEMENKYLNFAF